MSTRLVVLLWAGSALALTAASQDSPDLLRGLNSPWASGWVLADFDGDSQTDLATASAGRHDERGYSQEISVSLSSVQRSSFTFRSRYAKVELRARDMDGDHDRDIVIFEASSMEPVGIWLNDGSGHFQEGDLANFRAALSAPSPASFERPEALAKTLAAISQQRFQPAMPSVSVAPQDRVIDALASERDQLVTDSRPCDLRTRAPPRIS